MHLSILVAVTATAVSVHGTCFGEGERWGSQLPKALADARSICASKFSKHSFTRGEEEMGGCSNIGGNKMVNFNLKYIGEGEYRTLTADECYDGFQKEINGCKYGGHSEYWNWKYT